MVQGLRGNVELEKVFHENQMNNEGEWFVLGRESVSCIFANPCGGTRTPTLVCAWKVISSGTPSSSSTAKSATSRRTNQLHLVRKTNYLTRTAFLSLRVHFDAKVLYCVRSQKVLSLGLATHRS